MVNWNKVIKTIKGIADAHSHVKATEAALISSPANGIEAVKQAAKDHDKARKAMSRMCDMSGVCEDYVFIVCDSAISTDEKVKALLFNDDIVGSIIEACNTNDTNDDKEE